MIGGPSEKIKVFFFLDYQGTRTTEGITSPVTIGTLPRRIAPAISATWRAR